MAKLKSTTKSEEEVTKKHQLPYGSWSSPITSKFITSSSVPIGSLKTDSIGNLYWIEGRSQEGGRQVVCQFDPTNPNSNKERGSVDLVDTDTNVRTRVHEYGGGAYAIYSSKNNDDNNSGIIYSEFISQRLFWKKKDGTTLKLTPEGTWNDGQYRFADGVVDPSGTKFICVREDHGPNGDASPVDVVNEIISLDLDGSGTMVVLAKGKDFYQAPRIDPSGSKIAYISWNHPSMPWDFTELRVINLKDGDGKDIVVDSDSDSHILTDGMDGDTSILQPSWHPITGSLYYISDASGYYNIYCVAPDSLNGAGVSMLPKSVDFGGRAPGWVFGPQGYDFLADGRIVAHYPDATSGETLLVVFEEDTAKRVAESIKTYSAKDGLPHSFSGFAPSVDGSLYFIGGGPDISAGVYKWDGLKEESSTAVMAELLASTSNTTIPNGFVSVPKPIEFPSPLGVSYGYYYPPTNPNYEYSIDKDALPPLLVKVHGGPTACTSASFNPGIQFFTSRGFAVLDVDYGGSTGYGREYRRRLRGNWGIVDIDDVCAGAQHLVNQKLADPERLAIDGGSAGGYTTLGALAFKDVFTAGCSLYGVADISALAKDTHKFESRYLDGLIGAYPADAKLYEERAPINSIDTLSCPILLLQGDEDKIVPPNQAESMHAALLEKKIPTALKIYKGEQHGFRKAENIEDALNSEFYFYSKVFGFKCPDSDTDIQPFPIDNL